MKTIKIIALLISVLSINGLLQAKLPVQIRAEKQAMSTPMTSLDEVIFTNYYNTKPVNIKFDGSLLDMYFDNGVSFAKKTVTEVKRTKEMDDNNKVLFETIMYTDNTNKLDTISYIIDHSASFVNFVLPTKNTKGEYVGYTSYRQFIKDIKENELASR